MTLTNTLIPKELPSYRKETICACKTLLYLDTRPVTAQERALSEAWKEGGLNREKEVRAQFHEEKVEHHRKIYQEIEEQNSIVRQKRQQAFNCITQK